MQRVYRIVNGRSAHLACNSISPQRFMSTSPASKGHRSGSFQYALGGVLLGAAATASILWDYKWDKEAAHEPRWQETKPHGTPLREKYADKATMLKVSPQR